MMDSDEKRPKIIYLSCEIFVAVISVLGNALVLCVFLRDRRLRTPTNLYVFSLAVTDFLTSTVATPVYVFSMITQKPRDFLGCLSVHTMILTFCTVSIFHLIAVSFDRYMAIVWRRKPNSHARGMRHAAAFVTAAWCFGILIGCLPLMGWNQGTKEDIRFACTFMGVMRMEYLMFLFYGTIIAPTFLMIFFYASIYLSVRAHNDRMVAVHCALDTRMSLPDCSRPNTADENGGVENSLQQHRASMLARNASIQHRQSIKTRKIIKSLILVVSVFLICWYPLYIMNAVVRYCKSCRDHWKDWWFYAPIILTHVSSAINPFIYARTMPGYKEAFVEALACKHLVPGEEQEEEEERRKFIFNSSVKRGSTHTESTPLKTIRKGECDAANEAAEIKSNYLK